MWAPAGRWFQGYCAVRDVSIACTAELCHLPPERSHRRDVWWAWGSQASGLQSQPCTGMQYPIITWPYCMQIAAAAALAPRKAQRFLRTDAADQVRGIFFRARLTLSPFHVLSSCLCIITLTGKLGLQEFPPAPAWDAAAAAGSPEASATARPARSAMKGARASEAAVEAASEAGAAAPSSKSAKTAPDASPAAVPLGTGVTSSAASGASPPERRC